MDVEKILNGAVRFSNFISVRLVFFTGLSLLVFPLLGATSVKTDSLLEAFPLVNSLIVSYGATINALGIESVAVYLIFFVFITVLHLSYSSATTLGAWLPPHLGTETLRSAERSFNREIVTKLKELNIDTEHVSKFSESTVGKHSALEKTLMDRIESTALQFNATKAFFLAAILTLFFAPPEKRLSLLSENRTTVIFGLLVLCACYFHYLIRVNRLAFDSLNKNLEHALEVHVRPFLENGEYTQLVELCERHRKTFSWQIDWLFPVVGSFRYWMDRITK